METGVVYESESIRIEASQKGWLAVRALNALIETIALWETGSPDWGRYLSAKNEILLALEAFERWHGNLSL